MKIGNPRFYIKSYLLWFKYTDLFNWLAALLKNTNIKQFYFLLFNYLII